MTFCIDNRLVRYAVLAGLGLSLIFSPLGGWFKHAEAAQVATVNVDNVNLRSGPGTNTAIAGQAKKGQQLTILSKNGDWYQVQVGGKSAWVAGWLVGVKEVAATSQGKVAVVTSATLNIRSGPGTNYGIVGGAKKGDSLNVLAQSGDWYKVQLGNATGYVANWLVSVQNNAAPPAATSGNTNPVITTPATSQKVAVVTADSINIRSGAGTSYGIVGKAKKGDRLDFLSQSGQWYKVKIGSVTGWVANWLVAVQNVQVTSPPPATPPANNTPANGTQVAVINADNINLRNGPSTSHAVAGQVSRGIRLPVISRSGDWVQVRRENGSTAWVAGWLVAVVNEPEETVPPQQPQNNNSWLPSIPPDLANEAPEKEPAKNGTTPTAKLVDVQVTEKSGHTYINVVSEKAIDYNTFTLSNPYRYVVNINDVQLGNLPETVKANTELVSQVRTGYNKDPYYSRLVIDLDASARVKASLSSDKKSLTLDIYKISYSDGLAGKTIFLDAGHGGADNGASGQNGLREKEINLAITLKVAEILRNQGANVIFSRSDDTFIELYDRTKMANEQNADIFVSIHSNANTNRSIGGTATYYYAPTTMPNLYEQKDDRYRLAEDVQSELAAALGRRNIGVLQANFAVLRTSVMPSILIETAFVSNAEEEALLGSNDFRQKAAEAIAKGLSAYFSGQ